MNRPHRTVASVSVMAVLLMAAGSASAQSAGLDRRDAQVTRARAGQPLTAASSAAPATIVTDYLRARGRGSAVPTLRVASVDSGSQGMKHLRMQQ